MQHNALLLERLGALIHQSVRDDAARHGLLPIHVQVLSYLSRANRYSDMPIAVAEYFGVTRGTVSQTLAVLERKGLLVRESDARHGRRVHLGLTPSARALLRESWITRLETALTTLPLDAATLESGLRGLLAGLQRLNGQRAFGVCARCAHFQPDGRRAHCGLTGEPLAKAQTLRICREWRSPHAVTE
ncbi:MAG: MarR family transcriptional regulator [Thiobacillus sp.]|nr:MarR family transcriptional regulator [Thiobacillus sp.]